MSKKPTDLIVAEPAFLKGEERKAYVDLFTRVRESVKPRDAMERIWTRDIVDLTFYVLRYRAILAGLHVRLQAWPDDQYPDIRFRSIIGNIACVERLTAGAEDRRNEAYRQIKSHRAAFGHRLHETVDQVESEIELDVPQITDQSETESVEEEQV